MFQEKIAVKGLSDQIMLYRHMTASTVEMLAGPVIGAQESYSSPASHSQSLKI